MVPKSIIFHKYPIAYAFEDYLKENWEEFKESESK